MTLQVTPQMRLLLAIEPVDFRKGIDGLVALCKQSLGEDPLRGSLFAFRNRRGEAVKALVYDGQGYWLCLKRLRMGRFRWWPSAPGQCAQSLAAHQWQVLLSAGDPSATKAVPAWRSVSGWLLVTGEKVLLPRRAITANAVVHEGHGRNGAEDYPGATRVSVPHAALSAGDPCPSCDRGTLYCQPKSGILLRFTGQPPVQVTIYELEKLRCGLCGEVFTAKPPDAAGLDKYDSTVASMIDLLKYGNGLPFNRRSQTSSASGHRPVGVACLKADGWHSQAARRATIDRRRGNDAPGRIRRSPWLACDVTARCSPPPQSPR